MATIRPRSDSRDNALAVAVVLGLDINKVSRDGFTMEPLGSGDWLVTWQGSAILHRDAAAVLFGNTKEESP